MHARRERIFNLPTVTKTLIVVLTATQLVVAYGPLEFSNWLLTTFAFIPARVTLEGGAEYATMLTYFFLHGDWTHLIVNALALAAFGTPVERRFGSARYLLFLAASAFAGALLFLALHPYEIAPVVGASGAISGTMGAIVRFAFTPGARLADKQAQPPDAIRRGIAFHFAVATAFEPTGDVFPCRMVSGERASWRLSAGGRRIERDRLGSARRRVFVRPALFQLLRSRGSACPEFAVTPFGWHGRPVESEKEGQMTISNILAEKGREVVTASADTTLQEAAQLMMRYRIGALVILDDSGRLAGLIAERDIVSAVALDGPEALTQRISAYMQPSPQPAREDDAVENTMRVMTIERRRHIPVIRETRLVGLVSIGDVVKYRIRVIEEEHRSMREYIAQA